MGPTNGIVRGVSAAKDLLSFFVFVQRKSRIMRLRLSEARPPARSNERRLRYPHYRLRSRLDLFQSHTRRQFHQL